MRGYIPRSMATQHPDNAAVPSWTSWNVIQGEDEVFEAYYVFNKLGVHEVMWDSEGKDVDLHVIRKLLERFSSFFSHKKIGRDFYLTYRLPNPLIEGADRKVFMETLESIPASCDVARAFYGKDGECPIFEVIIPMTTGYELPVSIALYYEKAVVGKQEIELIDGVKVKDLVGPIAPEKIEVIPLVEDLYSILNIRNIVNKTMERLNRQSMRVFVARSDPAMNYGLIPAIVLAKIAISELYQLMEETGKEIFPIIGVGSLPFRGGLTPYTVERTLDEYRGYVTFTIQSAFRYDFPEERVIEAIKTINESSPSRPKLLDKSDLEVLVKALDKLIAGYQQRIEGIAHIINQVAELIPKRRARKLHIGLFGYPRSINKVRLPRAIPFVGSMYSLGIPPELIGFSTLAKLSEEEYSLITELYENFEADMSKAYRYYSPNALNYLMKSFGLSEKTYSDILEDVKYLEDVIDVGETGNFEERKHAVLSELLLLCLKENREEEARRYIEELAILRRSIG